MMLVNNCIWMLGATSTRISQSVFAGEDAATLGSHVSDTLDVAMEFPDNSK